MTVVLVPCTLSSLRSCIAQTPKVGMTNLKKEGAMSTTPYYHAPSDCVQDFNSDADFFQFPHDLNLDSKVHVLFMFRDPVYHCSISYLCTSMR
jgi:hypothetical protein